MAPSFPSPLHTSRKKPSFSRTGSVREVDVLYFGKYPTDFNNLKFCTYLEEKAVDLPNFMEFQRRKHVINVIILWYIYIFVHFFLQSFNWCPQNACNLRYCVVLVIPRKIYVAPRTSNYVAQTTHGCTMIKLM